MRFLPLMLLSLALQLCGAELCVDPTRGDDKNAGTSAAPFATAQQAINKAQAGDTIQLLPKGAIYRQKITLNNKSGLTILGNGVTLTGADPLPLDGWEQLAADLHRRKLPQPAMERHMLIVAGRAQRMGNSASVKKPFPAPAELKTGEFSWEAIDEKTGWLTVRGPLDKLEWVVRENGLATGGKCRDIIVRDLKACHVLNDGFNIHGDCRGFKFVNIQAWENFDEGISAHEACECFVEDSEFWGNDNAAADVNAAETFYTRCTFRESVSVEVLFQGGKHALTDCKIIAANTAFSLSSGGMPKSTERSPGECTLTGCSFKSIDAKPKRFAIDVGTTFSADKCTLGTMAVSNRSTNATLKDSTLNGQPWK